MKYKIDWSYEAEALRFGVRNGDIIGVVRLMPTTRVPHHAEVNVAWGELIRGHKWNPFLAGELRETLEVMRAEYLAGCTGSDLTWRFDAHETSQVHQGWWLTNEAPESVRSA